MNNVIPAIAYCRVYGERNECKTKYCAKIDCSKWWDEPMEETK